MERDTKGESRVLPHGLSLQDRQKLAISGVSDVVNFDENQVIIMTGLGTLTIRGSGLHVDQLSLESGELRVTGTIDLLEYDDSGAPGGGFFRRLFQ